MAFLINSISSFTEENGILGTYVFGSNLNLKHIPNSDIDLLIVVKEKNIKTKRIIEQSLNKYFTIIHHPDFYSKRLANNPIIELIVIPFRSKYFKNQYKGILTGLSAFVQGVYIPLNKSPRIDRLIDLPNNDFDLSERIDIILKCEWGINDYLTKLWPLLNNKNIEVDFNRVVKFLIMDLIWAFTGKMIKDQREQEDALKTKLLIEFPEIASRIITLSEMPDYNSEALLMERLFDILYDLREQFKLLHEASK